MTSEAQSEGRTVAYRGAEKDGRATSADDHRDGRISQHLAGPSPQGEENTLAICQALIRAMNRLGDTWEQPVPGDQDEDCIAKDLAYPGKGPIRIQVVRAAVDSEMWQALSLFGQVAMKQISVAEAGDTMAKALRKKVNQIPKRQRRSLVLALDASLLPGLAFESVINSFHERHQDLLDSAGFQSVWIVGPTESLTRRLDSD
jgi:hypothetical protein